MQDEKPRAADVQYERSPWVAPALSRLQAGSAELLAGPTDDNADFS